MKRREFIAMLGYGTASLSIADALWAEVADQSIPHPLSSPLRTLCNVVLPATDTLGAGDVGVGDWLIIAAQHGLENSSMLQLEKFINAALPSFDSTSSEGVLAALTVIDDAAFNQRDNSETSQSWRSIKSLILLGYYTSEVGAKEELQYDALPGELNNDLTIDPEKTKAWSSDWTAVMFS